MRNGCKTLIVSIDALNLVFTPGYGCLIWYSQAISVTGRNDLEAITSFTCQLCSRSHDRILLMWFYILLYIYTVEYT